MAEMTRRRAYVSVTYDDVKEHRHVAGIVLRDFGYEDVSREFYAQDVDLEVLAAVNLYVAIVAWRYDYVPSENNPAELSISELEYSRAVVLDKPRLIFLGDPRTNSAPSPFDHDERKITAFRDRLVRENPVTFFTSPRTLQVALTRALVQLDEKLTHHSAPPSPKTTALIRSLTDSPERLARLLAWIVLADRTRLALLESPNTAGIADALGSHNAQNAEGVATLIGRMDDERFEPDPLWLAWITNIHRERLTEIGSEILRVSGLGGVE